MWRVKEVLFKKNNEYESAWDNTGNTNLNKQSWKNITTSKSYLKRKKRKEKMEKYKK